MRSDRPGDYRPLRNSCGHGAGTGRRSGLYRTADAPAQKRGTGSMSTDIRAESPTTESAPDSRGPQEVTRTEGARRQRIKLPRQDKRHSKPITDKKHLRAYVLVMSILGVLAIGFTIGIMTYDNPAEIGSRGWWLVVDMRRDSLLTIAVVALCHAMATIAFQTATNNRIITPGIMGFGSLYTAIQTGFVY